MDAHAWLDEQTARIVRGEWADPRPGGRELLSACATRWQSIQVSSPGTARTVANALRLHILPRLGGQRIANIRRSDVQAFVKWLETRELRPVIDSEAARTLSAGSVLDIYEVLVRAMDGAVEDPSSRSVLAVGSPCRPKDHDDEVGVPTRRGSRAGPRRARGALAGDTRRASWVGAAGR